jgi:WD repeat-containing protein 1 (actin-interacting protein 1)
MLYVTASRDLQMLIIQSGKSIFVRSIDNPAHSSQYTGHTAITTVSRFAPSGFYVASGDQSGIVRVWDCVGENQSTKGEYSIFAGPIYDVAWDGDSQRIIAVGEGKERMGHCISWDSGNTVGEISGHSQRINSVSIRQQRPLRAATGSDDMSIGFFHGVPFKFNTSVRGCHDKFVFGTAFSPDGNTLVSVGADRKIWLYDGKTGEQKCQIGPGVHIGSIFGVAWAKDSKRVATASADQTVRIWDVEAGKAVQTWRMGEEGVISISNHQVGITWPSGRSDDLVISVDLDGNLNYFTKDSPKGPSKVVQGHQKNVTAAGILRSGKTFFTGSYEGRVCEWDVAKGTAERVEGDSPSTIINSFAPDPASGRVYTVSWDDTLRSISAGTFTGSTAALKGQPRDSAVGPNGNVYVVTATSVEVHVPGSESPAAIHEITSGPTCIAIKGNTMALGCNDKVLRIYDLLDNKITEKHQLRRATAAPSTLEFSQDGSHLAVGVSNGKILAYETKNWEVLTDRWSAHTAKVTSVAWDPDRGDLVVSGSLDTNVYVWSLKDPARRIKALNAHKDGVSGVAWADGGVILSTGGDATVKVWKVEK